MPSRSFRVAALASCALPLFAVAAEAAPAATKTPVPAPAPPAPASTTGSTGKTSTSSGSGTAGSTTSGTASAGAIKPLYGSLTAFYGNVSAMYGRISPFYGRISPFYGRISAFWGSADPFTAISPAPGVAAGGATDGFWGSGGNNPYKSSPTGIDYSKIAGFWTSEASSWATVESSWSTASSSSDATKLANLLQTTIINPAITFWGPAVQHGAPAAPGTSGPAKPGTSNVLSSFTSIFTNAGVTFNANGSINANSLLSVTPEAQSMLFLNFYDRLMDYSGTGHVDWWMGAVHWSPALAQTEGTIPDGGTSPTVGMLDFVISSGTKVSKQITQFGSTENNGHGAAVGSLIMGATDGSGVLGVLPPGDVNVVVYDPYDSSNTTNWTDVGTGLKTLTSSIFKGKTVPVGVLNASLGVSGWTLNPGWNDALANAGAHGHNLVIAAGNDGITQTQNVAWNFAANPTLIIVGSVGLDGTISPFSNKPGEACLLDTASTSTSCTEANKLKYHFIVAPGEFILVSDGQGGHTRQSGTSLAAPLVSGAIALLQNRWPWLANYSDETAQIILKSATPLGTNPGADAVYGVGELNIQASQSPLDWSKLVYHSVVNGKAGTTALSLANVLTQVKAGTQSSYDTSKLYFTAIETIGRTYRDFQIPLSSKLVGQKVTTGAGNQMFQSYLTSALEAQATKLMDGDQSLTGAAPLSFQSTDAAAPRLWGMGVRFSMALQNTNPGFRTGDTPYQADAAFEGHGFAMRFGFGNGAPALDQHAAFGFQSDYDFGRGGASPLLGLASGGTYAAGRLGLTSRLNVSIGYTGRNDIRNLDAFGVVADQNGLGVRRYQAQAEQVSIDYAVSERLGLRASLTSLHENDGLLGTQSLDPADLSNGSVSRGATLGFDYLLPHGFTVSGAGTLAMTRSDGGQLTTGASGLRSASAEIALAKQQVFGFSDQARLALSMPMHTIGGKLHYADYGVVDRDTGALGIVDEAVDAGGTGTPLAAEFMYGRRLTRSGSEVSLFSRVDLNDGGESAATAGIAGGAQLRLFF